MTVRAKENPKEKGMVNPVIVKEMVRVKVVNERNTTKRRGRIKVDCRKRIADEKAAKGKQNPQRKPNAAAPHDDEPEPLSAAVDGTLPGLIAAFPSSCKHILLTLEPGPICSKGIQVVARSLEQGKLWTPVSRRKRDCS